MQLNFYVIFNVNVLKAIDIKQKQQITKKYKQSTQHVNGIIKKQSNNYINIIN